MLARAILVFSTQFTGGILWADRHGQFLFLAMSDVLIRPQTTEYTRQTEIYPKTCMTCTSPLSCISSRHPRPLDHTHEMHATRPTRSSSSAQYKLLFLVMFRPYNRIYKKDKNLSEVMYYLFCLSPVGFPSFRPHATRRIPSATLPYVSLSFVL